MKKILEELLYAYEHYEEYDPTWFKDGMCRVAARICGEAYSEVFMFIHTYVLEEQRKDKEFGNFLFPPGEIAPRIKWLKERIKELEANEKN